MLTLLQLLLCILLELLDAGAHILYFALFGLADEFCPSCLVGHIVVVALLSLTLHGFECLLELGHLALQDRLGGVAAGHDLHQFVGVDVAEFEAFLSHCVAAEGEQAYGHCDKDLFHVFCCLFYLCIYANV